MIGLSFFMTTSVSAKSACVDLLVNGGAYRQVHIFNKRVNGPLWPRSPWPLRYPVWLGPFSVKLGSDQ